MSVYAVTYCGMLRFDCASPDLTELPNRPSHAGRLGGSEAHTPAATHPTNRPRGRATMNGRDCYAAQEAERAVRIRQERAQTFGYLNGACGEPRREALSDVQVSYDRGFEQGKLARLLRELGPVEVRVSAV